MAEAPRKTSDVRDLLAALARRARAGDPAASAEFQRRMQLGLGPIIRAAMSREEGPANVVRWVKGAAARTQSSTEITQQLCAELLRTPTGGPGSRRVVAETIVGV